MSREIRKVPADWVHPTNGHYANGEIRYHALFEGSKYNARATSWAEDKAKWDRGEYPDYADEEDKKLSFEEWDGERPDINDYMPDWPEEEKTHFMLYETTSEGTPMSPAFATVEELARWLTDNEVSTFGYNRTTAYENWLAFCKEGSAHSVTFAMSLPDGETISGVDLVSHKP
jgi:hypothetical protein